MKDDSLTGFQSKENINGAEAWRNDSGRVTKHLWASQATGAEDHGLSAAIAHVGAQMGVWGADASSDGFFAEDGIVIKCDLTVIATDAAAHTNGDVRVHGIAVNIDECTIHQTAGAAVPIALVKASEPTAVKLGAVQKDSRLADGGTSWISGLLHGCAERIMAL